MLQFDWTRALKWSCTLYAEERSRCIVGRRFTSWTRRYQKRRSNKREIHGKFHLKTGNLTQLICIVDFATLSPLIHNFFRMIAEFFSSISCNDNSQQLHSTQSINDLNLNCWCRITVKPEEILPKQCANQLRF